MVLTIDNTVDKIVNDMARAQVETKLNENDSDVMPNPIEVQILFANERQNILNRLTSQN